MEPASWSPPLQRPLAVGLDELVQNSIAQAPIRDPDAPSRKGAPDRLQDGAARKHEVSALVPDAAVGSALGVAHASQGFDRGIDVAARHPKPIDPAPVVAGESQEDTRNRRHRPRGAQQVEVRAAPLASGHRKKCRKLAPGVIDHRLELDTESFEADELLGQSGDAKLQRNAVPDVLAEGRLDTRLRPREPPPPKPNELARSTTDVEEQHAFGRPVGERSRADRCKTRFRLPVHDLKIEPCRFAHQAQEFEAVRSRAAGLRRNKAAAGDAARAHFIAANFKSTEGTLDGSRPKLPVVAQSLAEADNAGKRVDNLKPARPSSRGRLAGN